MFFYAFSNELLVIDHQLKLHTQLFRCLTAEDHPSHEDLKVFHHRSMLPVDIQCQLDLRMIRIDLQLGGGDRVIDPIVNVKRGNIPVAHPAAAHIRFIRKNSRMDIFAL